MDDKAFDYTIFGILGGTALAFLYIKTLGKDKSLDLTKTLLIGGVIGGGLGLLYDFSGSKSQSVVPVIPPVVKPVVAIPVVAGDGRGTAKPVVAGDGRGTANPAIPTTPTTPTAPTVPPVAKPISSAALAVVDELDTYLSLSKKIGLSAADKQTMANVINQYI